MEFGALSTGEPRTVRGASCDAAGFLPGLLFPEAGPPVMLAERTIWKKAAAINVYCGRERRRGERLSRRRHDLARVDDAGVADLALADRALASSVARHRTMFFPEKGATGERIDHEAAISDGLRLVPTRSALEVPADDSGTMAADGMLLGTDDSIERLISQWAGIEARANRPEDDNGSAS